MDGPPPHATTGGDQATSRLDPQRARLAGPDRAAWRRSGPYRSERAWRRSRTYEPLEHDLGDRAIGSVSETPDGAAPQHATGAPSQTWSVAKLLRVRRRPQREGA